MTNIVITLEDLLGNTPAAKKQKALGFTGRMAQSFYKAKAEVRQVCNLYNSANGQRMVAQRLVDSLNQ